MNPMSKQTLRADINALRPRVRPEDDFKLKQWRKATYVTVCYPVQRRCMRLTGHISFYVSQLEERGNFVQVELVCLFLVADGVTKTLRDLGRFLKPAEQRKQQERDSSIPLCHESHGHSYKCLILLQFREVHIC